MSDRDLLFVAMIIAFVTGHFIVGLICFLIRLQINESHHIL